MHGFERGLAHILSIRTALLTRRLMQESVMHPADF